MSPVTAAPTWTAPFVSEPRPRGRSLGTGAWGWSEWATAVRALARALGTFHRAGRAPGADGPGGPVHGRLALRDCRVLPGGGFAVSDWGGFRPAGDQLDDLAALCSEIGRATAGDAAEPSLERAADGPGAIAALLGEVVAEWASAAGADAAQAAARLGLGRPVVAAATSRGDLSFDWPLLDGEEEHEVVAAVRARDLSWPDGAVARLEEALAERLRCEHVLAHANGTSAMLAALWAVGVGPGTNVVCPSYTFWASAGPAVRLGAQVRFCDVSDDLVLDVDDALRLVDDDTRAVIVVHPWGNVAPVDPVVDAVRGRPIAVVEDASHAFGTLLDGAPVGTLGAVGVMSLQMAKPLPAGEGGILVTDDAALHGRALELGHYERLRSLDAADPLAQTGRGLKLRMSPLNAAFALAQLRRFPERIALQNALVQIVYREILARAPVRLTGADTAGGRVVRGGRAGIRLLCPTDEAPTLLAALRAAGVDASPEYFVPLHRQALFGEPRDARELPRTEALVPRLLALPLPTAGTAEAAATFGARIGDVVRTHAGEARGPAAGRPMAEIARR